MSLCEPTDPDDVAGRLNFACQTGSVEVVKRVVEECNVKNFDMLDQYGSPPLYNSVLKHDAAGLVQYLVEGGATVELRNAENETPFFIAAFNNHLEAAKVLLEKSAKVDLKGGVYGDYPIHVAVKNNHSSMVNLLISKKANINCRNDNGETPLFVACKLDRFNLAYTLLMNKANKGLSSEGKDCLYIASEKKNRDIVRLLKASGPAELMEVKHSVQRTAAKKKPDPSTWRDKEFKRELDLLGITESEAARQPREVHSIPARKPRVVGPKPLYDSDEEEELNNAASRGSGGAGYSAPPPNTAARSRYRDPAGTTYNPTGAAHVKDVEDAKEAFKHYHPVHTGVTPPPPGFIDHPCTEAEARGETDPAAQKQHSPSPPRRSKSGQSRRAAAAGTARKR